MNYKIAALALAVLIALIPLAACAPAATSGTGGTDVVATIFPGYDFVRQIAAGTDAEITLLLQPGEEVHSFDPTGRDIIRIQNADLFLCVGGESEAWADSVLEGLDRPVRTFRMMDHVALYEEELVSGMQAVPEDPGAAVAWDEHVWTAPVNAIAIVGDLAEELAAADPANADAYRANADAYIAKLEALDRSFWDAVNAAPGRTVVFADRFPARYFVEEFGLNYYAAFPGCAAETEPSAATIAALIDRVKADRIPVVFYIELSDERMADTVCEATGAQKMLFHTCHNVTKAEFESGATYLSLMLGNVAALKAALGGPS